MMMMMMESLISVVMFIFLLTILLPMSQIFAMAQENKDSNLIENTCKNTPNYRLCVSTLRSNPRSSNADIAGLGLILINVAKAKATNALNNIKKQLQKGKGNALMECAESYKMVLSVDIPEAVEALTKGDPKFAEDGMSDATREAEDCAKSLKQTKSPLTAMNKAVHDLSVVATSIIRMLL